MKDLQFLVDEQELKIDHRRCGNGFIVEGSRNYLRLKFRFKGWDNFEKHVQFIEGETHYEFLLDEDDSVKVPNNFIEDKIFKFLVVGYDIEAEERVTTNTLQVRLLPTEFSDDIHSYEDDTEDVYRYLVNCLDGKANLSDLSAVALTGDYDDLTDKPSIPSKISDLTDDSDFIEKSDTSGLIRNDGSVDTTDYLSSAVLDGYIEKSDTVGLVKNDGTVDTTSYSTFSGSYNDLSNKPTIPTRISDLTDDSDFIEKSDTAGLVKNDGTIDTTSYSTFSGSYSDLSNKPSIPASSSDLSDGSNLLKKSNTSGLIKNDGTVDTSTYLTSSAITGMLTSSDIVDNLTTDNSSKVLSAKQGKALNDKIGNAILFINGSGS